MTRRAALLPFGTFVLSVVGLMTGCDTASVYEDCDAPEKEMTGEPRCVKSTFAKEDPLARQAAGFVSLGSEHLVNAIANVNGAIVATDEGGYYRYSDTPFRYDASTLIENDVIAFHQASLRFLDLAVERDGPPRAYAAKVRVNVDGLPRPGNALAFFADGSNIAGVARTDSADLTVFTRTFENDKARIHVVEYPKDGGLQAAVAKGSVVVTVRGDSDAVTPPVLMIPVGERKSTTFAANPPPPPGFELDDVELFVDFGSPLNRIAVGKLKVGDTIDLPMLEDASWLSRTVARRADGAIASTNFRPFAPGDSTDLAFYAPPNALRNEGDVLFATSAQGTGVFEHVLVPVDPASGGGKTIHVFSALLETKVPDLHGLGLPPAHGEYTWTVRVFPDFAFVEAMSGTVNRLYRSSSTSPPRTIVLP